MLANNPTGRFSAGDEPSSRIAVALSGGGHRASLFALGVLLYLAQAGRNGSVTSIASVSGGSLANGAIATRRDYTAASADDVRQDVAELAGTIAAGPFHLPKRIRKVYATGIAVLFAAALAGPWQLALDDEVRIGVSLAGLLLVAFALRFGVTGGGTLFGWWGTWLYLIGLAGVGEAVVVGVQRLDVSALTSSLLYAAGALTLFGLVGLRGRVCARAFAHTLFPSRARTRVSDLNSAVDHVICATDLHAGEHVYFSRTCVCAYRFGHGKPNGLRLHTAVQASAAFPGAFPVTWVWRSRFKFRQPCEPNASTTPALTLVDGGVYDNMGDQWAQGLCRRAKRWPSLELRQADELVVVSASAGLGFGSVWKLRLPAVGALLALLRDKSVLYDNGNSVRRAGLVAAFDLAERETSGLRGALVHIEQSPFKVPDHFAKETDAWPRRAERAHAAQDWLLLGNEDESAAHERWRQLATDNACVPTTLVGFDRDVAARLLYHAYVLAAVNLHVILGYPIVGPAPTLEVFNALLEAPAGGQFENPDGSA